MLLSLQFCLLKLRLLLCQRMIHFVNVKNKQNILIPKAHQSTTVMGTSKVPLKVQGQKKYFPENKHFLFSKG